MSIKHEASINHLAYDMGATNDNQLEIEWRRRQIQRLCQTNASYTVKKTEYKKIRREKQIKEINLYIIVLTYFSSVSVFEFLCELIIFTLM